MKIYFDVCCLNRPFDDQTQDRIHLEAEAVITILKHIELGDWMWFSSSVVTYEIKQTPSEERQQRLLSLLDKSTKTIRLTEQIYNRAKEIKEISFKTYDSLHIACAEQAEVDIFLSTDDKLIKKGTINFTKLNIKFANPLNWLQEVL